jgi:hypothetical protein
MSGPDGRLSAAGIAVMAVWMLLLFWVYGHRPLIAEPVFIFDDALYLRQGEGIVRWLHGEGQPWLGPYDAVILTKTPLFAMWMAVLFILGLPLRVAEFGLLLLLPWLFRAAVRPLITLSWWQLAAMAAVLSALPLLPTEQRLLRTTFQLALTGGCEIATIGLILRARRRDARTALWATASGLLFALAYLNREESIWLVPTMLCGLGVIAIGSWSNRSWSRGAVAAGCLVGSAVVPIALVSALNYQSYGVFFTTARRAPQFTRAHKVMTALEPQTRERYVPIREATRLKAYAVSPSFARLRSYLEGPASDNFARNADHLTINGRSPGEREFFVMNFQPVLQGAAFEAGAHSAPESEALFAAIAGELEAAIASGTISAGSQGMATLAAPLPGDTWKIVKQTVVSLRKLFTLEGLSVPEDGVSSGPADERERFAAFTHTAVAPTAEMKPRELPDIGAPARRVLYDGINSLLMIIYAVTAGALLVFISLTAVRRRGPARIDQAVTGAVLFGSLLAFSFGMAMTDVYGFPLLKYPFAIYNNMGYGPLSVLSAFGLAVLISWYQSPDVAAVEQTAVSRLVNS